MDIRLQANLLAPGALFSAEGVLALFLHIGRFKSLPLISAMPVDPTALLFVVLCAVAAFDLLVNCRINRRAAVLLLAFACFVTYLLVRTQFQQLTDYGLMKVSYLATLVLMPMIVATLRMAGKWDAAFRFLAAYYQISLALTAATLASLGNRNEAGFVVTLGGANYQEMGYAIAFGAIIGMAALASRKVIVLRLPSLIAVIVAIQLAVLATIGARGAVIAVALVTMVLSVSELRGTLERLRASRVAIWVVVCTGMIAVAGIGALAAGYSSKTTDRFATLLDAEGGGSSANARSLFAGSARNQWLARPWFGQGVGNWSLYYEGLDIKARYPHSIVWELLSETGVVGLLLFALVVGLVLPTVLSRSAITSQWSPYVGLFWALAVFHMISGDLQTLRLFVVVVAVLGGAHAGGGVRYQS